MQIAVLVKYVNSIVAGYLSSKMFGNYLRDVKLEARNLLKFETREELAVCEIVCCGGSG